MKPQNPNKLFGALLVSALPVVSTLAASTDMWVGGSGNNFSITANWSYSSGSGPVASGDSLVFGSVGSTTPNNDESFGFGGITFNSGASAYTFGGNAVTLNGTLSDAATVNETFSSGLALGSFFSTINNSGTGTLNLGNLTRTAGNGGSVNFTGTGTISTTAANDSTGILGGWATVGNAGTSGASGDFAATNGSGNVITYAGYTSITAATAGGNYATQNWKINNASASLTGSATVNSMVETTDFSISSGATMTLNSGGLILSGVSRWLKDNGNGNTSGTAQLTSGLAGGELFVDSSASGGSGDNDWRIWPKIVDNGLTPVILVKNGPGYLRLENANTYSGGTIINSGTVFLSNNGGAGGNNALGTNTVTLNGGTLNLDSATLANNFVIPPGASAVIDNTVNNGTLNGNFTGSGTVTLQNSSGSGLSEFINGSWSGFTGTLNYNCSAGSSKNFNFFAPANLNLSQATLNITNTTGNSGSTFRGNTTCMIGALNGPNGYLDTGCTYLIGYLNTSTTFGGVVLGSSAITKLGTGALTLSGGSQFAGATTVENGSLIAGANVSVSANGPFGNSSAAIALGDALTISTNVAMNPQLLIGGAYTMARPVTVGASVGALGNAGTTFTLGGNTANSSIFSGNVTLNQNMVVTQAAGGTVTISGVINDGGNALGLTKVGAGTAILSGANSYTGSTVVSNGVLLIGNTTPENGVVTVKDGAGAGVFATSDATYWSPTSLTVGSSTGGTLQFDLGGSITGPNANTLLTPSSLTLNGTTTIVIGSCPQVIGSYPLFNGYTSGTLALGSQPVGVLGKLTVSAGTVYYQLTNFVQDVWTAAVNTNWDTVTANWTNSIGGNQYVSGYPVTFDDTAAGASPLLVNIINPVTPNSITVNNTNKAYTIGGLAISGSTGLAKNGTNTLTLTGTNTFTGNIAISAGTLTVGGAGQLGGGTYAGNIDNAGTLNFNSSAAQTVSGNISDIGAVVQSGSGTLTLPVGNSYSGGTTLSAGTTTLVGDNNALGTGTVNLNGGTLLDTSAGPTIANNINVMSGGGTIAGGGSGGNFTFTGTLGGAGNLTLGGGATPLMSLNLNFAANNMTSGTVTIPVEANNQTVIRFNTTATSSSALDWVINGAPDRGTMLDVNGTYSFGSLAGSSSALFQGNYQSGNIMLVIGGNNNSATFSGRIANNGPTISVSKVGTGTETFAGANTFTGGVNINGGILAVANAGALSSSGAIAFGGGTLQYSSANQVDYSARITNSTAPISIDLNGTNVTFATALSSSNTNGLALTNSTGTGTLTLTAANSYTGNTLINAGTLALSGSGDIASSPNINIASGGLFDVSAVSYILGGNQTLSGSGTITGAVMTAGSGSSIQPGGIGVVGTLTFQGDLDLSSGASSVFDLSGNHLSGNDQVVVAGNLTLNSNDKIHINALSAPSNLDTGDYVLFSVSGTLSMASVPGLVFDGTLPGNAAHYTLQASGNNVVLHYSTSAVPLVSSVIVTNTTDGTATAVRGQSVTVYVTVVPGSGSISSVTADLTPIGGSASQALTSVGGNDYSCTATVGSAAVVGLDTINVTATDTQPASGYGSGTLTVNAATETWNGLASDDNWSSGANWVGTVPPGYAGDSVVFAGSTRLTPNLDNNYSVAGVTFDNSAGGFTLGATAGKALTLTGGVTNNSSSSQVINAPIVLNGTQSILDPNGVGNTLAGNISGSGGLTMDTSGFGILTLSGTNTYSGDTTVPSVFGTLYLGSSAAIPNGAGKGNVSLTGTLNLNGYNAAINGLSGVGYVDNTGGGAVTLSIGNGDASSSFGGIIQNGGGALTVEKVGTGSLTLSGGNTYSGGTTLSVGQITLGTGSTGVPVTSGPLGTGALTLNGGTLQMNAKTLANDLIISAGTTNIIDNAGGNSTISGNLSGAGIVTLQNTGSVNMSVYGGSASQDWSGFTGTFNYITGSRIINFNPGGTVCDLSHAAFYMSGTLNNSVLGIGSGQTLKLGSLSGPSGYINDNSALEIGNLNADTTFGGLIQGSGNVTKIGSGTLTLSGANNYTGPTIVSNGTLVVSTRSTGGGSYSVTDGATLGVSVAGGGSLTVSNLNLGSSIGCTNTFVGLTSTVNPAITNSGTLTLAGTVTVNVQGTINIGQYPLISSASGITGAGGFVVGTLPAGAAATIITNGNVIVLNVTAGVAPQIWTGSVDGNWNMTTTNWTWGGNPVAYVDALGAIFDDSALRTNVTLATNVQPSSITVSNNAKIYMFTSANGSGIGGTAGLVKNGVGKLILANTNTYSGGTIINNGMLQLGDGVANNGVVVGDVTDNGNLTFANPTDQTFSGVISGTGALVKNAFGNLTLGLNNTYAGGTLLDNSIVTLPNGAVQAFGTGTLTFSNATVYVKPGGGNSYNSANSDYLGNNVVIPAGTANVIDNSANNYGNLWVGGDGVQWTGSGTLTIQNNSSVVGAAVLWNGNTLANFHGTLNIGATGSGTMYVGIGYNSGNGGTGASVSTFDASGTACTMDGVGSTLCQVVDAACTSVKFGSLSASNPNTVLRGNSSSSPASQLIFEVGALNTSTTFAGKITDWGSAGTGLTKVGTGTLELSGADAYTGPTTVNNGALKIDTAFLAGSSDVVIASPGVLDLNFSGNNTVNTLTLDGVQQAAGTYGATGSGAAHTDNIHFAGMGVLNVTTGSVAPTPEPINATFSGGVLQLSWSNSTWSLQMQTNSLNNGLSTNWTTLIPANSGINSTNITVDPTKPAVFYRLTYP